MTQVKPKPKLNFHQAILENVPALVVMLADDELGTQREDLSLPFNGDYYKAFAAIDADPNNELVIADTGLGYGGRLVGMMQLTFIPGLSHTGAWRCLIESVRIHRDFRGQGLGADLIEWAIERAKQRGCNIVQLTSDKQRPDAIAFYKKLGFVASHEGLKLKL